MTVNNNSDLINQICTASGLQGKNLEALRTRLEKLSEAELQAELTKAIAGNNSTGDMGLVVEKTEEEIGQDEEFTTDENGNEVLTETEDGEVIRRTIKSKDQSGNIIETIVRYKGGKPVNKIEKKNGNTISATKYTYHEESENSFEYVTLETEYPNRTSVKTNVLSTDEYGNYDEIDFISETTTKPDGTKTEIIKYNGKIVETETRFDGTVTETVYNGSDLDGYHSGNLNRLTQTVIQNDSATTVQYDGNGNTYVVVQSGEGMNELISKFSVEGKNLTEKTKSVVKVNREAKIEVYYDSEKKEYYFTAGERILIPGEHDAVTQKGRLSSEASEYQFASDQQEILIKELYTSKIETIKLDKGYSNLWELAKDNLIKSGIQNPTNDQINTETNKLILLNGNNFKPSKGAEVKIASGASNSGTVKELSAAGFEPNADNYLFYQKFNELEPADQENVLGAIQSCKDRNISDLNLIKSEIYNKIGINLFDSGKIIQKTASRDYLGNTLWGDTDSVPLEIFITDTLKLDLNSGDGKKIYERLASLPQDELDKISAQDFTEGMTFDSVADRLGLVVNIRTADEIQDRNNSPKVKQEEEKQAIREAAAKNISILYDNAINIIKSYQDSQGWLNFGFYREELGKLLSKVNRTDVATCFEDIVKRLEEERDFAVSYLKTELADEKSFKTKFKEITGIDYDEDNMRAFLEAASQEGADWTESYNKAYGDSIAQRAAKRVNFQSKVDGAGDIVLMLMGTEAIGKGLALGAGKLLPKIAPKVPPFITEALAAKVKLGGTVGNIAGSMATSSLTFALWDGGKNAVNILTDGNHPTDAAASQQEWEAYWQGNVESAKFGAAAGLINATIVGKVVDASAKLFEKPLAKATSPMATKAAEKLVKTSSSVSGADLMTRYMKIMNKAPEFIAQTCGFVAAELPCFTLYETANEVIEGLLQTDENGERHLPAKMDENGLASYLWEKLKGQAQGLGEIKAIAKLLFMHKGAVNMREAALDRNLQQCEMLKDITVKQAVIGGKEVFKVELPNGESITAASMDKVIQLGYTVMQTDMIINAVKQAQENPQGSSELNTEGISSTGETSSAPKPEETAASSPATKPQLIGETTESARPADVPATLRIEQSQNAPTVNPKTKAESETAAESTSTAPKGLNTEDNAFIQKAKTENPAEVVEGKVRKAWQESGLTEEVPEEHVDLFNLDPYAGLKEPAPEVNGEVTHLIYTGKLKETLTQHSERLDGVFKDIAQKHSSDFKKAAEECGSDTQAFAQRVVKILAKEMGMQNCKPNIKLTEMGDADGKANWLTGTIEINKNIYSAKQLVEIIFHEYVHMLQYRDIIVQYGEKGLREVIMADKSIPENEKETRINDVLNSKYTQKLLKNREQLKHAETGSLNEYIMRIYKDEFANNIGTDDMAGYTNQVTEREAYFVGSGGAERGAGKELGDIEIRAKYTDAALTDEDIAKLRQKYPDLQKTGSGFVVVNKDGKPFNIEITQVTKDNEGRYVVECKNLQSESGVDLPFDGEKILLDIEHDALNLSLLSLDDWKSYLPKLKENYSKYVENLQNLTESQKNFYKDRIEKLCSETISEKAAGCNVFVSLEEMAEQAAYVAEYPKNLLDEKFKIKLNGNGKDIDVSHVVLIQNPEELTATPKYYDETGNLVAIGSDIDISDNVSLSERIKKPNLLNVFENPKKRGTNTKFKNYVYNEESKMYEYKEPNKDDQSMRRSKKYPVINLNSAGTDIRRKNLHNMLKSESVNKDLKTIIEQVEKQKPPTYQAMCSALEEYLNQHHDLFKEYSDIADIGTLVLNFGMSKDGNVYVGINGISIEGTDAVRLTLQQNLYQGYCAETTLRAEAGENLRNCYVYDLKIEYEDGLWKVEQDPPCDTCYEAITRYGWQHPVYY